MASFQSELNLCALNSTRAMVCIDGLDATIVQQLAEADQMVQPEATPRIFGLLVHHLSRE